MVLSRAFLRTLDQKMHSSCGVRLLCYYLIYYLTAPSLNGFRARSRYMVVIIPTSEAKESDY